ncbi:MAG: GNAT superfamily N-acetyltransferase, partial [Myxococcota bacterium]
TRRELDSQRRRVDAPLVTQAPPEIREMVLSELRGALWPRFVTLQAPWTERGMSRWLTLIKPDGPHPTLVVGAFAGDLLVGTLVGFWSSTPLARFDDLFGEMVGVPASTRPEGGVWHLVGVTLDPRARGRDLGRAIVSTALACIARQRGTDVCTMSPAFGLAALGQRLSSLGISDPLGAAVWRLTDSQGRPALPVMRLHMGAGASLAALVRESRHDDAQSARCNLRFVYPRTDVATVAGKRQYAAWLERRRRAIERGSTRPIEMADGAERWLIDDIEMATGGV